MDRTYNKVGFSTLEGVVKLRFTTDVYREKVLERNGHEDVHLFDLPREMNKIEAAQWLLSQRAVPANVKSLIREMIAANDEAENAAKQPKRGRGRPSTKAQARIAA